MLRPSNQYPTRHGVPATVAILLMLRREEFASLISFRPGGLARHNAQERAAGSERTCEILALADLPGIVMPRAQKPP
jgi:hypothetical protein